MQSGDQKAQKALLVICGGFSETPQASLRDWLCQYLQSDSVRIHVHYVRHQIWGGSVQGFEGDTDEIELVK